MHLEGVALGNLLVLRELSLILRRGRRQQVMTKSQRPLKGRHTRCCENGRRLGIWLSLLGAVSAIFLVPALHAVVHSLEVGHEHLRGNAADCLAQGASQPDSCRDAKPRRHSHHHSHNGGSKDDPTEHGKGAGEHLQHVIVAAAFVQAPPRQSLVEYYPQPELAATCARCAPRRQPRSSRGPPAAV